MSSQLKVSLITPADIRYSYRGTEGLIFEYARFLKEHGIDATLLISDMHTLTPHRIIPMKERPDWGKLRRFYDKIPQKHINTTKIVFPWGYSPVVLFKDLPTDSVLYLGENVHSYVYNILTKPKEQIYVVGLIGLLMRPTRNPVRIAVDKVLDLALFKVLLKRSKIWDKTYYHVISSAQKRYLMRLGIPEDKIFYILPMIDTKRYARKSNAPALGKKLQIVHIGGIDKSASLVVSMIKILEEKKKLDSFEFYFIGRQQPKELAPYAEKYGNIHSLGRIEDDEKYRLMSHADVVIAPDYEGYSMAMVEGLASGLYILASAQNPGANDVKGMGAKIYLANTVEDHAKTLEMLAMSKKNRKAFDKGRQMNMKIGSIYDKEVVLPQMKKMFENAAKETGNTEKIGAG